MIVFQQFAFKFNLRHYNTELYQEDVSKTWIDEVRRCMLTLSDPCRKHLRSSD